MKNEFKNWLIKQGYSEFTPKGYPSTVYDYLGRIERVMIWERITTWSAIQEQINRLVSEYGEFGIKANLGKRSHNAVISALKAFQRFCVECNH